MNEKQMISALNELPREIAPPSDLWDDIEPRLDRSGRSRLVPVAIAAALIGAVAVGLMLRQQGNVSPNPEPGLRPAVVESLPDSSSDAEASEQESSDELGGGAGRQFASFLDTEYAGALREIRQSQPGQDAEPEGAENTEKDAELRAAFADIAAAQKRLRDRLDEDPDNLQLASLLALTHRQQARSLRALATMETSS